MIPVFILSMQFGAAAIVFIGLIIIGGTVFSNIMESDNIPYIFALAIGILIFLSMCAITGFSWWLDGKFLSGILIN